MRTKQLFFMVLILALLPYQLMAQSHSYYGRHVSIKLNNGDSIQYAMKSIGTEIIPVVQNGSVIWNFDNPEYKSENPFSFSNVESIDFRSFEYDSIEVRNALIDFYHAMGGDNWIRNDNWCSDKPINEWYGIICQEGKPWPSYLDLSFNNLSGRIPDSFSKVGPITQVSLRGNNIEGEIPSFLGQNYSLENLNLEDNKITGIIPNSFCNNPNIYYFGISNNNLDKALLPEDIILGVMNKENIWAYPPSVHLYNNNFIGNIPQSIQEHSRFSQMWSVIVPQKTQMDVSDLIIPAAVSKVKDLNGDSIDIAKIIDKNKYTLIYSWGSNCKWSNVFNQKLIPAYLGYKEKGFEVIGLHGYVMGQSLEDMGYDSLNDFMIKNNIPWNNTDDWHYDNNLSAYEGVGVSPTVYLIDNNRHIVFNSLVDEDGNNVSGTLYRDSLFSYLERHLGKIDYQYYTSSDYSHDGEIITLQTASEGQGVDLVFVGEGFVDKDYEEGGCFNQRMNDAMEQFFAYEPYTSLRNRFNVYVVKAVSPNAEFLEDSRHAIDEDISIALQYASKVPMLKENEPMRVAVVYKNVSGGRSYCNMFDDNSFVCFAMDGANEVLNHEAGGHGIGRLFDEYVEPGNELSTLPEDNKDGLDFIWSTYGWGANVDWRSDATEVKWSHFINDTRYADEQIGVYEGSYLYGHGAYRPTENSMMRYNDTPFNAPSREAIYKRVMQESEGDTWNYDYETFVAFDAAGREQFVNGIAHARQLSKKRGYKEPEVRTLPPVMIKGTWRDALKKK